MNEYFFSVFGMLRRRTTAGDNFLTSIDNTQKLLLYYKQIRYLRNYTNRLPLHKIKNIKNKAAIKYQLLFTITTSGVESTFT